MLCPIAPTPPANRSNPDSLSGPVNAFRSLLVLIQVCCFLFSFVVLGKVQVAETCCVSAAAARDQWQAVQDPKAKATAKGKGRQKEKEWELAKEKGANILGRRSSAYSSHDIPDPQLAHDSQPAVESTPATTEAPPPSESQPQSEPTAQPEPEHAKAQPKVFAEGLCAPKRKERENRDSEKTAGGSRLLDTGGEVQVLRAPAPGARARARIGEPEVEMTPARLRRRR